MIDRWFFYVCSKVCSHHGHRFGLLVYHVVLEEPLPALVLSGNTLKMLFYVVIITLVVGILFLF